MQAQAIFNDIPEKIDPKATYMFYLHGGVVQDQGANAVSQYYGKYEYQAILDSLSSRGYYVISEVRPKNTQEKEYAKKLNRQITILLNAGVAADHIVVVGASLGAYITLETALIIKNPDIQMVLLGLCSQYALKYFSGYKEHFYGRFLSIYELSDSKGSCKPIFISRNDSCDFSEIALNMGIDHAFLFKPHKEWMNAIDEWLDKN